MLLYFLLTFCIQLTVNAQSSKTPKWMCQKGFWVIQGNVHSPKVSTIYFYNNDQELVYKEQVYKRINANKLKTRKHLEFVLNQSVTAWQKERVFKENQQLVISKP